MCDVLVVGGGLAGLAAGATVARDGGSVVVLEARRPGGRARTTEREGFTFNLGAHALYVGGAGMPVLRRLGVDPKGTPPPLSRYKVADADGTLHVMPSGPSTLLRTTALGARDKAQLGKLLAMLPRLDPADEQGRSVDEWLADRGLRPEAERMLRALIRIGTYGPPFDELGADAAITQLQAAAAHGVLYLDGGWAQLVDGLRAGVEVRTAAVRSVAATAGGVEVMTDDGVLTARAVVLAPGVPAAVEALLPDGLRAPWGDLGAPVTAACLDCGVRGHPDPGYVLGLDEAAYATTQSPPARQAPEGCSVVSVLRYGARSPDLDRAELRTFLHRAGVADDDVIVERFLARMVVAGTMPRAVSGGLAGRPSIGALTPELPGVFVAGDWVGPEGLLADAALASGHAAGRAALAAPIGRAQAVVAAP